MSTKQIEKASLDSAVSRSAEQHQETVRGPVPESFLTPPVTIFENAEGVTILADMPGVAKDRVELSCDQDTLTLEGELSLHLDNGDSTKAVQADIQSPRFRRSFVIGSELDKQAIKAEMKDGVLEIRIPKIPSAQPFKIDIG